LRERSWGEIAAIAVVAVLPTAGFAALAWAAPLFVWRNSGTIKAAVALAGMLLLLASWALERAGRGGTLARTRDALLLALGLLAGFCWWNLGTFHRDHYVHEWDAYHYYVGAKYAPELGYTRLYLCTIVADAEEGRVGDAAHRKVRDLETNRVVTADSLLLDPGRCTGHFSPERWQAFKHDVAWFRQRIGAARWPQIQRDHGFNATPVWLLLGRAVASTGSASTKHVVAVALIDPVLLMILWAVVVWAFGWWLACVALLFWGGNYFAYWGWTGGSFLRQDWLIAAVLSFAFLRRGHMVAAGFALGVSGLLRVFPWVIASGLALKALWIMWERRSFVVTPSHRRFALGFALSLILLVPVATVAGGGASVWSAFVVNTAKHASTPAVNYLGLKTLLSYDADTRVARMTAGDLEDDTFRIWREARARVFAERRVVFFAVAAGFVALLALAVQGKPDWVVAVLGVGLIPVLTEISCYYYSIFLAFAFLAGRHPGVGVGLTALTAGSWLFLGLGWEADARYVAISALLLVFVALATAGDWLGRSDPDTDG